MTFYILYVYPVVSKIANLYFIKRIHYYATIIPTASISGA